MARAPVQRDEAQKQREDGNQGVTCRGGRCRRRRLAVDQLYTLSTANASGSRMRNPTLRDSPACSRLDGPRAYAPLSGLAALVENSPNTVPKEFLNAFDGIESRATTVLLGAAAMLERDAQGTWVLVISSGNFVFLERDAADGFARLRPLTRWPWPDRISFVSVLPSRGEREARLAGAGRADQGQTPPYSSASSNTRPWKARWGGRPRRSASP